MHNAIVEREREREREKDFNYCWSDNTKIVEGKGN